MEKTTTTNHANPEVAMTNLDKAIRMAWNDTFDGTPAWDAADIAADSFNVSRDEVLEGLAARNADAEREAEHDAEMQAMLAE